MKRVPTVEHLPTDRRWVRGARDWRPRVSLRREDRRNLQDLMAGTGCSEAGFLRFLIQSAIRDGLLAISRADTSQEAPSSHFLKLKGSEP